MDGFPIVRERSLPSSLRPGTAVSFRRPRKEHLFAHPERAPLPTPVAGDWERRTARSVH
ncbi:MAG: hypothetical protein QOF86_3138 [Baekduia sp.]|nr:hypothetical protein [Baekduia sp.]